MERKSGNIRKAKLRLMANPDTRKLLVRSGWNEIMFDLDGDGVADLRLSSEKGHGNIDTLAIDLSGNGEFNLYLHDADGNGIPDTILWAEDGAEEVVALTGDEVERGLVELAARVNALLTAEEFLNEQFGITLKDLADYVKQHADTMLAEIEKRRNAQGIEKVAYYLDDAGTYFLATEDGDQARVRAFGTSLLFDGKLYIQTGKSKDVSKQIAANPRVELCAAMNGTWLRVTGELVDDDNHDAKVAMLEKMPSLKAMYSADDDNMQMLYFKNASATFSSFTEAPETINF